MKPRSRYNFEVGGVPNAQRIFPAAGGDLDQKPQLHFDTVSPAEKAHSTGSTPVLLEEGKGAFSLWDPRGRADLWSIGNSWIHVGHASKGTSYH